MPRFRIWFIVLLVILFILVGAWWWSRPQASSTTVMDSGVIQTVSTSGSNVTETFAVSPEWSGRGVRCLIITTEDAPNPLARAQLVLAIPSIRLAGLTIHRSGRQRVDSVMVFYTFDASYQPPQGLRGEKSLKEMVDEMGH